MDCIPWTLLISGCYKGCMPLTQTVFLQTRPIQCSPWEKAPISGLSLSTGSFFLPQPEISSGSLSTSIWPLSASCLCHFSLPWMGLTFPCMKQEIICSRVNTCSYNWSFNLILELLFTKGSEHSSWKVSNNSKVVSRCFRVPSISHLAEKTCSWVEFLSAFNFFLFSHCFHWSHFLKLFVVVLRLYMLC